MKKVLNLVLIIIVIIGLTACTNKDAINFKNEYESLNGKVNSIGKEHRKLNIKKDNPYVKVTPKKIVDKIKNKDTFYLYVGDPLCPWCRSVLEKSIEVSKKYSIKKIYYIDIWDDDGNEILRDKYEIKDGSLIKTFNGTKEYKYLLKSFDNVLSDYTLTNDNEEKIDVGEKRIYAPNFIYIKDGKALKLTEGTSEKQIDAREKLTDEILEDEEKLFSDFFYNK